MKRQIVLLISLLFILGCGDDEPVNDNQQISDELFTVSGMVSINDTPIDEADVTLERISSNTIYNTQTDASGEFSIDVLAGSYEITVNKAFADGTLVFFRYEAEVDENIHTESIALPEPVTLSEPPNGHTDGFTLNWSESTSTDFLEYKLYTHTTPDIDENTGTLIYTGTSITDTSFLVSENLVPLDTYYYRVFVIDTTGETAGSNVVEVTIDNSLPSLVNVSGNVFVGTNLSEGVEVQFDKISDNTSYATTTNQSGEFSIANVQAGDYTMSVQKTLPDNSFSVRVSETSITQSIFYDDLTLDTPINLPEPGFVSGNTVRLDWSQSTANDFQEYSIYMGNTADVNETTGTLIHTESAVSNTQFDATGLTLSETYFFRVYARNSTAIISGSNILEVTAQETNFVLNGDFEGNASGIPTNWAIFPTIGALNQGDGITVVDNESYEGNNSLYMQPLNPMPGTALIETGLSHEIGINFFEPNATYKVSFYMKYNTTSDMYPNSFQSYFFNSDNSGDNDGGFSSVSTFPDNDTWQYYEYNIYMLTVATTGSYHLSFEIFADTANTGFQFWIDNVKIVRVN